MVGHVITTTPLTLSDTTITTPTTTIDITSFFSSPSTTTFYAPSGHLHKPTLTTNEPPSLDGVIYIWVNVHEDNGLSNDMNGNGGFGMDQMGEEERYRKN
ncbi:hypothetical protein Tco_1118201 [Tanacetum coccineum]